MKKNLLYLAWTLAALFSAGSATRAQDNGDTQPIIKSPSGKLKGTLNSDRSVRVFRAVPYALPPTGSRRWKAPQPIQPWDGILDASRFPPSAIQPKPVPFMMWTEEFISPPEPLSEDCLYLNIWSPAGKTAKGLPVLVWIHGGGFVSGSGACAVYDGEAYAKKGVVFVSINYRLGVFGFLEHPAISAEPGNASGNFALLDQVAALQWIRKNISAFGGDPGKVTIAGQSAGSMCVNALVASPLAAGLFRSAITQSGLMMNDAFLRPKKQAAAIGEKLFSVLQVAGPEEARQLPAGQVLQASGQLPFRSFAPYIDGQVLPAGLTEIFSSGKQNRVPLLVGWVAGDGDLLQVPRLPADSFRMKLEQQFPGRQAIAHSIFKSGTEAEALASQQKMSLVQFVVAQAYQLAAMNTQPGFLYHFSYVPTDKPGFPNYGAFHTSEVPFALHTLSKWNRPWKAGDLEVEKQVSSYWLNFIKTGNPNGPGLAEWPAFRAESGNIMEFGEKPVMRNRLFLEEVRLMTNSKP